MRKATKTIVSLLLVVSMCLSGGLGLIGQKASAAPPDVDLTGSMVGNDTERVDEITVAGRTSYMYVPESYRIGNFLALTPMVAVLGDEKFADADEVLKTAHEKGFAEIAQERGVCVLFVNPVESWDSEADAQAEGDLYAGIVALYNNDPTTVFVNGVGEIVNPAAGDLVGNKVYPGATSLQVFAEGKGADYAAKYFTKLHLHDVNYATQYFIDQGFGSAAASLALFNPSALEENTEAATVIPMAVVNGPENAEAVAKSYNVIAGTCKVVAQEGVTGFDAELVKTLYKEVVDKYFLALGELRDYPHYASRGIIEVNATKTVSTGTAIEYYEYIPDDIDLSVEASVPLLVWFHGMGGEAEYQLAMSDWPLVAKENGFIVVSVDQHYTFTDEEVMELIDAVYAESPYLDPTRLYVGGFSMGSAKTWSVALKNWKRIAAIIPNALGLFGPAPEVEEVGILPTFYIAGGLSEMELGSSAFTQNALTALWKYNQIGEYSYDAEAGEWGAKAFETKTTYYSFDSNHLLPADQRVQEFVTDSFQSADGNVYTWFTVNKNRAHTVTNNDAWIVWEHIKQFSRNLEDGSVIIAEPEIREELTSSMTGNKTERVDTVTVAGRTSYMYVPESYRIGNFLALTPVVVVLGDEAFTAESALTTALTKGFKEIAETYGACVLFLNPIESWDSAADAAVGDELFAGIMDTYNSDPTTVFVNGVGEVVNPAAGDKVGNKVYPGSLHGLQVFGEGKGADYAAKYFTQGHTYDGNYATQYFPGLPGGIASGLALFAPSTLEENVEGGPVIPMAIVNGPANAQAVADSYNVNAGVSKVVAGDGVTGFDAKLVLDVYRDVLYRFYYSQGEFREYPDYVGKGILEVNGTVTVSSGASIEYYEYIPGDLDLTVEKSVPIFVWFHGFGGEGEAMLSWTEWPLVGNENGFIVLSVDQHYGFTPEDIMELIDAVYAESPYLDPTRLYVGGFSMGGMMTWNVAFRYWDRIAAIVPNAAGFFGAAPEIKEFGLLPTFYIAGGLSPFETGAPMTSVLELLWKFNHVGYYEYDETVKGWWGVEPDSTVSIEYDFNSNHILPKAERAQVFTIDSFESTDGNTYTWLSVNENRAHTVTNDDAWRVWEYIKHFSRLADGSVAVDGEPVEPMPAKAFDFADYGKAIKGKWFEEYADYVATNGLMEGKGSNVFDPSADSTRAEFLTVIARLAGSEPEPTKGQPWYDAVVAWGKDCGITDGTKPTDVVTREMAVTMLYRYAKYAGLDVTAAAGINFTDAGDIHGWAADAVEWASSVGIINGIKVEGGFAFKPQQGISRAEVAKIITVFCQSLEK